MPIDDAILARLEANRDAAITVLAGLVRVPSGNPPGDGAHPVPETIVRANGMASAVADLLAA